MEKQLKVSIIIPIYNAEKYLSHCIDSLLHQGIPQELYEIICVNDGSKDDSLSILNDYASKNRNIIVVDKENEGVSATRNKGLDVAKGKYVWFIDADDWIAKGFLRKLFVDNDIDTPLLMTKCVNVYESNMRNYLNYMVSENKMSFEELKPFMTTARGHFFDRKLIEENNLRYNTNLSYGEDLIFMREFLDIIRFENEKEKNYSILQCNEENVYMYRIHEESAMGKMSNRMEKVADNILFRSKLCLERYKMQDKPDWYKLNYQEYVNLQMQEYMIYYFPALSKKMWKHLKELKNQGLYPSPPPKLGWVKEKNLVRKIQQFAFKHSSIYPIYYLIMRMKFKKAGTI